MIHLLNITVHPNVYQSVKSLFSLKMELSSLTVYKYTKEIKIVWDKIYKLCFSKIYTYTMTVYASKDKEHVITTVTATESRLQGLKI
jgi:hypothetical protein